MSPLSLPFHAVGPNDKETIDGERPRAPLANPRRRAIHLGLTGWR